MLRRLLPLLALVATALAVATPARAASGMEMGVQDDDVLVHHYWGNPTQFYQRAKEMRASWLRIMVEWSGTMPASQAKAKKKPKVTYTWKRYDDAIKTARTKGVKVQLVLTGPSPAWASGNKKTDATGSVSPNAAEYGKWAGAAAKHFKGLGVTRFSVWNEPNHLGYLRSTGAQSVTKQGKLYRDLYRSGYAAIRKNAASSQILFGELAPWKKAGQSYAPLAFLRSVLGVSAGYKKRSRAYPKFVADGFAQHPYDNYLKKRGRDDVTMNSLNNLTSALDKLAKLGALKKRGGGKLGVYLSEFGYFSRRANKNTVIVPESKRPSATTKAYATAYTNPRVRQLTWYQLYEPTAKSGRTWLSYFLYLNDKPMPTFDALVKWAKGKNLAK